MSSRRPVGREEMEKALREALLRLAAFPSSPDEWSKIEALARTAAAGARRGRKLAQDGEKRRG